MPTVISFQSKYASLSSFFESFRSESQDIPQSHLQRTRDEPTNPKVSPKFRSVASVSNFKHPSSSSPQRGPSPGATSPRGGKSTNRYSLHHSKHIQAFTLSWNNFLKYPKLGCPSWRLPQVTRLQPVSLRRYNTYSKHHPTTQHQYQSRFPGNLLFLNTTKNSNIPQVRVHNEVQARVRQHQRVDHQTNTYSKHHSTSIAMQFFVVK